MYVCMYVCSFYMCAATGYELDVITSTVKANVKMSWRCRGRVMHHNPGLSVRMIYDNLGLRA